MSTENLGLKTIATNILQPDLPVNFDMLVLDAIAFGCRAEEIGLDTPPTTTPDDIGKVWIIGTSPTGRWAVEPEWENGVAIAISADTEHIIVAQAGMEVWDKDTEALYRFDGAAWTEVSSGGAGDSDTVTAVSSSSGVLNIDLSLGDYFTCALSENITSITFSNLPGAGKGGSKFVRFTQDSTPRTVAWPASFRWDGSAPTVSTGSGDVDLLAITTLDNGTKWDATLSKDRT